MNVPLISPLTPDATASTVSGPSVRPTVHPPSRRSNCTFPPRPVNSDGPTDSELRRRWIRSRPDRLMSETLESVAKDAADTKRLAEQLPDQANEQCRSTCPETRTPRSTRRSCASGSGVRPGATRCASVGMPVLSRRRTAAPDRPAHCGSQEITHLRAVPGRPARTTRGRVSRPRRSRRRWVQRCPRRVPARLGLRDAGSWLRPRVPIGRPKRRVE